MHDAARESLGTQVTDGQLSEVLSSTRKLEVVLARLSGTAGRRRVGAPATVELFAGYCLCRQCCDRLAA
jgi:hypothetical protein